MKRFLCILLSAALLLCLLAGCGSKNNSETDPNASSNSEALTEDENDTMHLNMLFSLIGTPDMGVTELLGDGSDQKYRADGSLRQRTFDGVVYGADIEFSVCYDEYGDVSSIDVDFDPSISEAQLTATITELTRREPVSDNTWQAETAIVSLTEKDGYMCMTLTAFSPESAEDPVQY